MTHLTAGELRTWYEQGGANDRDRIIGHLAECQSCRQSLSALAMAAEPAAAAAPLVTAEEAVPLGYAARKAAPSRRSWTVWLRPAYGLAGAAVIVLAVLWLTAPPNGGGDDAVRSSELMALAPSGATNSLEFRWASPFEAARYRLVVRDSSGTLIYTRDTTESSFVIDAGSRARFATMVEYSWTVSALDATGAVIAESKPRGFLYQP